MGDASRYLQLMMSLFGLIVIVIGILITVVIVFFRRGILKTLGEDPMFLFCFRSLQYFH